jgi:hypothetical protein
VGRTGKGDESLGYALVYLGGDFNVTLFHSERSSGARMRRAVMEFAEFTMDQGLMDLTLIGGVSTWSNSMSWSRLDRFLVFSGWESRYPDLV